MNISPVRISHLYKYLVWMPVVLCGSVVRLSCLRVLIVLWIVPVFCVGDDLTSFIFDTRIVMCI